MKTWSSDSRTTREAVRFKINVLIGLTIFSSLKAVGVVLVLSLFAATTYLLVNRLQLVMLLGILIRITFSITEMYLRYYYDLPSDPAIIVVALGIFILSFLFSPS
ncbi:MAG: metal ABC transporter permease [Cyanobacteria bacterium P01_E01_bin.35]